MESNSWKELKPTNVQELPKRASHAFCLDEENGRMYIFGGDDESGTKDNLYEYDMRKNEWREIGDKSAQKPKARFYSTMAFLDEKVYLFGGEASLFVRNNTLFNDLWCFDLSNFTTFFFFKYLSSD